MTAAEVSTNLMNTTPCSSPRCSPYSSPLSPSPLPEWCAPCAGRKTLPSRNRLDPYGCPVTGFRVRKAPVPIQTICQAGPAHYLSWSLTRPTLRHRVPLIHPISAPTVVRRAMSLRLCAARAVWIFHRRKNSLTQSPDTVTHPKPSTTHCLNQASAMRDDEKTFTSIADHGSVSK